MLHNSANTTIGNISTESLYDIFRQAPVVFFVFKGPHFIIELANEKALQIMDRTHEAIINRPVFDCFPELVEQGFPFILNKVFNTGERYEFYGNSIKLFRKGKIESIYIDFACEALRSDNGGIIGIIATGTDRTAEINSKIAVLKNETIFQDLIKQSSLAIGILKGENMLIELANDTFCSYWGKGNNIIGKSLFAIIPEIIDQGFSEILAGVYKTGKHHDLFNSKITLSQHGRSIEKYFNFSYRPFYENHGEISGVIISAVEVNQQPLYSEDASGSELGYLQLLRNLPVAVYTCDKQGVIDFYNDAAEILWGIKPGKTSRFSAFSNMSIANPEPSLLQEGVVEKVLSNGRPIKNAELICERVDHKHLCITVDVAPIRDSNNEINGALVVLHDITERKEIDEILYKSDFGFREMVIQAPVGITILRGHDFFVELANEQYLAVVDRTEEEFVHKPLFEALPEVKSAVEPLLRSVLDTGKPYYGKEFPVVINRFGKKENTFFNFVYQPLKEASGIISGVIVVATEVTSEVQGRHSIMESERQFRNLIMQSPIPMTIWRGPDFIIEIANEQMVQHIWRKKKEDVIGKKALEVFPELNDQKYPALLRKVINSGFSYRESESIAYVQGDDGMKKFYLDFEYAPLLETDNSISGIMITVNDVTEEVQARQKVEDAEARLRMAAEGTGLATWDLDLVSMAIIYSSRLNEIFGQAPDTKLSHTSMRAQIHTSDRENIVEPAFARALQTGIYDYEARVLRPDSVVSWIRTQGKVIFDKEGNALRMLGTMRDITIQRNVSKAIEDSEHRLSIAVQAAELGTWELNLKTKEAMFSDRYLEILGFLPSDKPSHETLLEAIHPDDRIHRDERVQLALKSGTLDTEMRIIYKDKSIHWIKGKGKVIYDEQGQPERMLGTIMDVTEQKKSLEYLKESEERFKTIANTAPVMIWMSGSDKFSDFFNTSWLNFTGRSLEEEVGEGWLDNVHSDDIDACKERYIVSYSGQAPFYVEYRLKRYDGVYRWISDNAVPRYDSAGHFIGFISACMDIDDEKGFNQRLQESELLFKTISNASPVGLWMTNDKGENTFVNDTWIEWTGTGPGTDENKNWLHSLVEADRDLVRRQFLAKAGKKERFSAEFRFKRSDGPIRWGITEGFPYFDAAGTFMGYAGSVTDITDRKNDELRKNDFLAVASHELKTPITSIKAYAQLLSSTYGNTNDAFLKNALIKVDNQVNKMTKLVADFLNLSKIESDKFQLVTEVFNLNSLVKEAVSDIHLVNPGYMFDIQFRKEVEVKADKEKVLQVLTNFLTNAVKYSPNNKTIKVFLDCLNKEAVVSVSDQGIGIKPEEHHKIFERFYRAGPNNIQFSGFGIGLYISAEIIRKHGGEIGVESQEGEGARFYFKLPVNV